MPRMSWNPETGECFCDGCWEALPAARRRIAELEAEIALLEDKLEKLEAQRAVVDQRRLQELEDLREQVSLDHYGYDLGGERGGRR